MANLQKKHQFRQKSQKPSRNQGLPLPSFPGCMLFPDGAWKKSRRSWSALTATDRNSSIGYIHQ
uniref:Resistance gene analog NBS8 n=1 Tax=Solanum tuberosum TaxID=4113 RepID=M1AR76_SOLTU